MTTSTDFAKYLTKFLSEYLPHERNVSPNTIASYRDAFIQFIDYMKNEENRPLDKLVLSDITRDVITSFLRWVMDTRKCSAATRNYRLAAMHSFVNYLQYVDIDRVDEWQKILSIRAMKEDKKAINYLSVDGIKLLLEQPDTINYLSVDGIKLLLEQPDMSCVMGRRHLAILSLMYDTGARVQEMADLTVESVRIGSEPYTLRLIGKGRKARIVPLMKEQVYILRKYMEEHFLTDISKVRHPLFFNTRGEKLTRAGITYILKTYADLARKVNPDLIPETLSCHSLRHSKAVHLLEAGINLVYVRDVLGHVSIQTTDVYARASSKAKREALEKAYTSTIPQTATDREWERNKNLRDWLKGMQK